MMKLAGKYFCGNKISDYGIKNGFLDYSTLAKSFDAVLNNDIMSKTYDIGYWDQESGFIDNSKKIEELQERIEELEELITDDTTEEQDEETTRQIEELENEQDEQPEIFQYYIISDAGARTLEEINEIVFYNEVLDMYVWGVTHWGTSWDYVLTSVPCNAGYND